MNRAGPCSWLGSVSPQPAVLAAMGTTQHGGPSAGARRCSRRGAAVPLMVITGEEDTAVACSAGGFMVGKLMEQQSAWNQ